MINVFDWIRDYEKRDYPFLILGKGPSFSLRNRFSLEQFTTVSLNHVIREQKVDVAHMIDIDVVEDCHQALLDHAEWLLMPEVPHINSKPTPLRLHDFVNTVPVLREFERRGRLLCYPLWTARQKSQYPIATGTFSGSIVVNLLSRLGVEEVRSLGVDGGISYSHTFNDLTDKTLFRNGHASFDVQLAEIKKTVEDSQMSYAPLVEPIRIFVGCDDSQIVAAHVLEYSIRKHTKHPVQVFMMRNMPIPTPKDKKNRPGTGFSFNRFLIPQLAGYHGKAIYIDADMLVFDDISKLWDIPFDGKSVLCSTQTEIPKGWEDGKNNNLGAGRYWTPGRQMSVMLLDCSKLKWNIDEIVGGLDRGDYSYKDLMAKFCIVNENDIADTIPSEWNCLEWYEAGRSQLVHFTVVPTQPWSYQGHHLNDLWEGVYKEAVAAGAVPFELIEELTAKKYIKPTLLPMAQEIRSKNGTKATTYTAPSIPDEHQESSRLRHMLWDSMIHGYKASTELNRIKSSPAFFLEDNLIRKPFALGMKVLNRISRTIKR